jgi:hypothetical protein
MKSYIKTHAFQLFAVVALVVVALAGFIPGEAAALGVPLMALATFNNKTQVPQGRPQSNRRVEIHYRFDFTATGGLTDGTGLANGESAIFASIPAGFVYERADSILRTAEGEAATLNIGYTGAATAFLNAGSVNGTPNALITQGAGLTAGTYFHTNTDLEIACPGANTINVAVVDFTLIGYMVDLPAVK